MSSAALARGTSAEVRPAAACLGLAASDVRTNTHPPTVVSVGLPFLVVELASRAALRRACPNRDAFDALLPLDGAHSVYAYELGEAGDGHDLHARMFTGRMVEDPATGSATAAAAALLATLRGAAVRFRVLQGEDMGRPSTLLARSAAVDGGVGAHVGGRCVSVFTGCFELF